jgi:carbonic anhydrase
VSKGIDRFLAGYRAFNADSDKDALATLAAGQQPDALVIACSDSRVIPEQITGAEAGTLFVVRNIGNLVPPAETGNQSVGAAIAYALDHLGVRHLIVLGHYRCGAMAATRDVYHHHHAHADPAIPQWLAYAERSWRELEAAGDAEAADWHDRLVEENVLQQLANALEYPAVQRALAAGKVELHAWVYDMARAEVRFWDAATRAFVTHGGSAAGAITPDQVRAEDEA